MSSPPNYLEKVYQNVRLEEGISLIEKTLVEVYFQEGISTKELARKLLLPIPLVSAIKKEFIKEKLLIQDRGIRLSTEGKSFVENELGFKGLKISLYQQLISNLQNIGLEEEQLSLKKYFEARPQVDVTIDQSKATPITSFKRAILCLRSQTLIGKQILCVGDDDLVSVALGFLLKKLYPNMADCQTKIHVLDIDRRFLEFIEEIAGLEKLPIRCHSVDLRNPLPRELQNQFDCFFTDPPYTLPGMTLFLSRGISGLKKLVGLPVFFSFAHKSPDFTLKMQREFQNMGLAISEIAPRFNEYEGAEIIGNTGQMIILHTSNQTEPAIKEAFQEPIYTGEIKRTARIYKCKECGNLINVGFNGEFTTIEEAKEKGCPICENKVFDLAERVVVS